MGEPCVPWPLLHAWQVMNVQHSMLCFVVDYIMLAVNGHGRGTRLDTCLVQQQCASYVVASAACVIANKCCVLFLISLHLLCMGMDEARALVHALCSCSVSPVSSPLLHASLLINVVFC